MNYLYLIFMLIYYLDRHKNLIKEQKVNKMSKIRLKFLTLTDCEKLLGKRDSKKLKSNTYLERSNHSDSTYHVRYYNTNILTINQYGWYYSCGNYGTVNTKERLNQLLPSGYYISQKKHIWYIDTPEGNEIFKNDFHISTIQYFIKQLED